MAEFPINANVKPAVDHIDQLIDALRKTGKQAGMTEAAIEKMVGETKTSMKDGVKNVSTLNSELGKTGGVLKTVGGAFAAMFALDRIKAFVGEVVRVTSEFQKLEAVLTNTLGSKSQAQAAMIEIQELAKKTPFSVLQLTESFVKLANRGVKPTMEQMKKMGDVAATLGKDFSQVTEAILDISNSERWKEVGIQSEKAGNKMRFTFRGVTEEVDATVEGVTNAIAKFGEMNGVLGATDAISATIGGKISNLGDAWDQFLNIVGDGNNGAISGTLNLLTLAVDKARELVTSDSQNRQTESLKVYSQQAEAVKKIYDQEKDADKAREIALANLHSQLADVNKQLEESDAIVKKLEHDDAQRAFAAFSTNDQLEAEYKRNNDLVNQYNDLVNDGTKAIIETTNELKKKDEAAKQAEINARLERERLERERINKELEKKFKLITDIEDKEAGGFKGNADDALNPGAVGIDDLGADPYAKERADERQALRDAELEAKKKHDDDMAAAEKDARDMSVHYAKAAFDTIMQSRAQAVENEIAMLRFQMDEEIGLAGNNEKAKDKIRKDFAKKEADLQDKLARRQQQAALFGVVVEQGPAIARTMSSAPFPYNLVLALAVAGYFAALIGSQKKHAAPRFAARGDYDISGPGTETSDSIPYMLSVHESVVHAKGSKKFGKLLRPMIEDKNLDWGDVKDIVDMNLPTGLPPLIMMKAGSDSHELRDELRAVRQAIENKQETRLQFDEDGFGHWMGKQGSWTKYIKSRYSI